MTATSDITVPRSRKRIDGWRWAGRIFLFIMLLYTAVPMVCVIAAAPLPT